jgi:NAD+ synthase
MRNYENELTKRVEFIRNYTKSAKASGIVFGNSGGKDAALVGILCKTACENTVGVIMPCSSKRNYGEDKDDANAVSIKFGIDNRTVDLTAVKNELTRALFPAASMTDSALANIAPRLRMTVLYSIAAAENRLVAGTGNRSERYMGYFTKWGDGACDFNPVADLTVTEVYEFLRYLGAPENIIKKAPSAGLFEGQTDEAEMGVTYEAIDKFLLTGQANEKDLAIIEKYHAVSEHKRKMPAVFGN